MNVYPTKQIDTKHQDLIQDIAYDFFGKRVATASLDQLVKIWNINDNNEWILKDELKIMPGLYKVAWAHPEFGQVIAVAHDRLVWLYEEASYNTGKSNQTGWLKRLPAFTDARAPITDIKFGPKYLGLQLCVCTANGEVRIYECTDILSSNAWTMATTDLKSNMLSCSSCSWSTCFNLPVLLALGSDDSNSTSNGGSKLAVFELNDNTRQYTKIDIPQTICQDPIRSLAFAPSIGKLYHTLAIASKSLIVLTIKPSNDNLKYQVTSATLDNDVAVWRVCWNTVGSVLASAGDDRRVRLWKCNYMGVWRCFGEITGDTCMTSIDRNFNDFLLNKEKSNNLSERNPTTTTNHNQFNNGGQLFTSTAVSSSSTTTIGSNATLNYNQFQFQPQQQQDSSSNADTQSIKYFKSGSLIPPDPNLLPWH